MLNKSLNQYLNLIQQAFNIMFFTLSTMSGAHADNVEVKREDILRAHLYDLGYPRQPSPRVTLAELTFHLFL